MNLRFHAPFVSVLALLAGCMGKVPEHLRIEPSEDQDAEQIEVTDLPTALTAMVRKDPLARSPLLLSPEAIEALEGGAPIAEWIRTVQGLERGDGQAERTLQQLEDQYPGTVVVPLARGYRLRLIENRLASLENELDNPNQLLIVSLLSPLQAQPTDDALPRPALEWLQTDRRLADTVRAYGDRWVLTSWLHAPGIDLGPVGATLSAPLYDGLAKSPTGALVLARAAGRTAPIDAPMADLKRATLLALTRAAADRDKEQAEWAAMKTAAVAELGADDPVALLLQRARDGLTAGAGAAPATGGALLAIGAMRWQETCGEVPCFGLDRVETMRAAGTWAPEILPLADAWQVIALKESLDTMDVAHETVLYPKAIVELVDALGGTGARPLERQLLLHRSPDASVWLSLGRAVAVDGLTDWKGARAALGAHLQRITRDALASNPDPELVPLLERISTRAIP